MTTRMNKLAYFYLLLKVIMDRRIKPWVNKKIIEYIGEPEPTLVDFICSKVLIGSQPQSIINDVQMVRFFHILVRFST